jgi:uncharacterized membrane protein YgcG
MLELATRATVVLWPVADLQATTRMTARATVQAAVVILEEIAAAEALIKGGLTMDYVTAWSGVLVLGIMGGYFTWLIVRGFLTTPPLQRRRFNAKTGIWVSTVGGGGVDGALGFDGGGFDGGCGSDGGGGGDGGC